MMKKCLLFSAFGCFVSFALSQGGVSVDLTKTKAAVQEPLLSQNLLTKTFHSGGRVWKRGMKDEEHRKRILTAQIRSFDNGIFLLNTPSALAAEQNSEGEPWMSSYFVSNVILRPKGGASKYTLSLKARGKLASSRGINSFRVLINFYNKEKGPAQTTRKAVMFTIAPSEDWQHHTCSFAVPENTRKLEIYLLLYGQGRGEFKDMDLREIPAGSGVSVSVTPWHFLDRTFCIGEGLPGTIHFVIQNEHKKKFQNLTLKVNIPDGFKLHSGNINAKLISARKNPDKSTTALFSVQHIVSSMPAEGYNMWAAPAVTLIPCKTASDQGYNLSYSLLDGKPVGEKRELILKIIPPFSGRQPKRFVSGIHLAQEYHLSQDKMPVIAAFLANCGLNAMNGGLPDLCRLVKSHGITRYRHLHLLCNGYRIGGEKNRTKESFFRLPDGKPFRRQMAKTCPVEVYKRGLFYRQNVLTMLKDLLVKDDVMDHLMSNWEPYYMDYKGCFCERCREEFIRFAKPHIQEQDIRKNWPHLIQDLYLETWIKFRSFQHGKVCAVIEEDVRRLGQTAGKESHFLPEIAWSQLIEGDQKRFAQYSPLDYMEKLPWIAPWGPYIFSDFTKKHTYYPGIHLMTWRAAKDNKEFIKKHIENSAARPRLIAMPQGVQCGSWITEPEALAFETIGFFLQGWQGSIAYYFPRGYDHRYWKTLAHANSLIASTEDLVMEGKEDHSVKMTPVTPVPRPFFPAFWAEGGNFQKLLPGLNKEKIVQLKSFKKEEQLLVAIGNFWQKGEVFVKLTFDGLADKKNYSINSSENYSLGIFKGKELADGIIVHIGALRWNLLSVVPEGKIAGNLKRQDIIKMLMQQRLPIIRKTAEWEQQYFKKYFEAEAESTPDNNFSDISPVENAGVFLKTVKHNDQDCLKIKTPSADFLISPASGGRIISWKQNNHELAFDTGWGGDAFWAPKAVLHTVENGYKVTKTEKKANGISVELEKKITSSENEALAGIRIIKSFIFTSHSISVQSTLSNVGKNIRSFVFRFHNAPSHLKGNRGTVSFSSRNLIRERALNIVRFGKKDSLVDTAFPVKHFVDTEEKYFSLCSPHLPPVKISLPEENTYGVIFWDSGRFSTMEPVFEKVIIDPGKSVSFRMDINWKN